MRFSRTNSNRGSNGFTQVGFTLLEFVLVIALVVILMAVARPAWDTAKKRSKEVRLASNLHTMRQCINQYVADKGKLPESLDALVAAGYFGEVPMDPITGTRTWDLDLGKLPSSNELVNSGVRDVHSTSEARSLDGTAYNTW